MSGCGHPYVQVRRATRVVTWEISLVAVAAFPVHLLRRTVLVVVLAIGVGRPPLDVGSRKRATPRGRSYNPSNMKTSTSPGSFRSVWPIERALRIGTRRDTLGLRGGKPGDRTDQGNCYKRKCEPLWSDGKHQLTWISSAGGDKRNQDTTSEELQSSNEELETMNEELQSTNEELNAVNEELRQRTDELNKTNAFLQSILAGMRSGAVVVNQNLNILVWNHRAGDLWGLRGDEVQGGSLIESGHRPACRATQRSHSSLVVRRG